MTITQPLLDQGLTYAQYRALVDEAVAQGRTTGPKQTEELAAYTKLNAQRMKRLDKTTELRPEVAAALAQVEAVWYWLVLTEGWCGDAAQNIPGLEHLAQAAGGHVRTRYLLRDEHPALMDAYLTNGGRSIPKLVCLRAPDLAVLGTWGPRPQPAQALVNDARARQVPYAEYNYQLQVWYNHNHGQALQTELLALVHQWQATTK
jgi:Thioredoxin